jgi:hypothetical protein
MSEYSYSRAHSRENFQMKPTWIVSAVVTVVLQVGAGIGQAQFKSRFGDDWPTLKECLTFSEETGFWGGSRSGGWRRTASEVPLGRFGF